MSIIVLPTGPISWESMVVDSYVNGVIEIDQLEEEIAMVLVGDIPQRLIPGMSPFHAPALEGIPK